MIKNLRVDDFIEDSKEYLESSLTKDSYVIILSETNLRKNHIYGSEIFSNSYGPFRNSYRRTEKYSGLNLFLSPSFFKFQRTVNMSVCGGIEVEAAEAVAEAVEAATVVTNVTEANGKKKQLKPCRKQMANCFFIFF